MAARTPIGTDATVPAATILVVPLTPAPNPPPLAVATNGSGWVRKLADSWPIPFAITSTRMNASGTIATTTAAIMAPTMIRSRRRRRASVVMLCLPLASGAPEGPPARSRGAPSPPDDEPGPDVDDQGYPKQHDSQGDQRRLEQGQARGLVELQRDVGRDRRPLLEQVRRDLVGHAADQVGDGD